jgi:guanosine-3',5'-bis(diphosphate) 3'-pyrophosphohydrolase
MPAYSARFDAALCFAACAHRDQVRKGSGEPGVPYIIHPMHVATILMRHGFDEDLVIAGLLHDTVEDCEVALETIARDFGTGVAGLVDAVTEKKLDHGGERRPWRVRKEEQLHHLIASTAPGVAALKAADALHNASCTIADIETNGQAVWSRFNASAEETVWYYGEIQRACARHLGAEHPLVRELESAVARLAAVSTAGE